MFAVLVHRLDTSSAFCHCVRVDSFENEIFIFWHDRMAKSNRINNGWLACSTYHYFIYLSFFSFFKCARFQR